MAHADRTHSLPIGGKGVLLASTYFLVGYGNDPRRTADFVEELALIRKRNGSHETGRSQGQQVHDDVAIPNIDTTWPEPARWPVASTSSDT